jgi:hypothetical protein
VKPLLDRFREVQHDDQPLDLTDSLFSIILGFQQFIANKNEGELR